MWQWYSGHWTYFYAEVLLQIHQHWLGPLVLFCFVVVVAVGTSGSLFQVILICTWRRFTSSCISGMVMQLNFPFVSLFKDYSVFLFVHVHLEYSSERNYNLIFPIEFVGQLHPDVCQQAIQCQPSSLWSPDLTGWPGLQPPWPQTSQVKSWQSIELCYKHNTCY